MSDPAIIAFYRGTGPDHRGRKLPELQTQSLTELEQNHDYIQWLFPLPEPSSANPYGPVLTPAEIAEFQSDPVCRQQLLASLAVMLGFYGLEWNEASASPAIIRSSRFSERQVVWLRPFNHNFLRLTRILRSLMLLGCGQQARALFSCLEEIYAAYSKIIGPESFGFWKRAVAIED